MPPLRVLPRCFIARRLFRHCRGITPFLRCAELTLLSPRYHAFDIDIFIYFIFSRFADFQIAGFLEACISLTSDELSLRPVFAFRALFFRLCF
jgi:hypothetical protein